MNCPCCSGRVFDRCCGRFISHGALPENAVELMRSRYSAYVLGNAEYLLQTWHPAQRPTELGLDDATRWLGLGILAAGERADGAWVEFEARLLKRGRVDAIHERSDFVRERKRWLYTRGDLLEPSFESWKPGRNEFCPCGSGRKFKRCCRTA